MLDERGVHYQYLDGKTSMAARKAAIDAFQAGQGEVFLISLKAGGFGLNLTAADYVVHHGVDRRGRRRSSLQELD